MSRPGFVLEVDDRTPPLVVHEGLGFRLEDFPVGTRVIYPPESLPAIDDVDAAIREALLNPVDADPLPTKLFAGMRLTIAFDDISLPLPPMRAPDIRQRIIEAVLTLAAAAGVDDVKIIAANALHRRMTPAELKHIVGERVFRSFFPQGDLYNHDAEDRDNLLHIGMTDRGEDVEINRRAAESDLLVYVNVNLVAMDGGHKSVPIGLASYKSLRHHHNPKTMVASHSFMDHTKSHLHHSAWRMGRPAQGPPRHLPDRDHAQQRRLRHALRLPDEARVGVVGARPGLDAGRCDAGSARLPRGCGTSCSTTCVRRTA